MHSMVAHIYVLSVAVDIIYLPACSDMGHATANMALMWQTFDICQHMRMVQYRSDWGSHMCMLYL